MKKIKFDEKEFRKIFPTTENSQLASKYNVAESTIRLWGARMGLNKKTWLWSRMDENYLLKHYGKDRTIDQISEKLKRSRWSIINKYREAMGLSKKESEE